MGRSASQVLDQATTSLREAGIELPGETRLVRVDQLEPNPWNPNEQDDETFLKEKASIRRFGFVVPIIARAHPDKKGTWQIIDGEHRWKAAIDLGMERAPIYDIGPVGDHEAMQLTVVLNELRGKPAEKKLAEVLKSLLSRETVDSLTEVMPFSKDDIGRIVQLPEFDWDGFREKTKQSSEQRHVERIFRLSPEAARVLDEALAKAKDGDARVSDTQALEAIAAHFVRS